MQNKPFLRITWAKAFGEVYCHHAALFIPYQPSLFFPDVIRVGINVRKNMVCKGVVSSYVDVRNENYLPCVQIDGGIEIPLNSTPIIEALSLNSWTMLKGNKRGTLKEFPLNMFYCIEKDEIEILSFNNEKEVTPYMMCENLFHGMKDGDKVETVIALLPQA